MAVLGIEEIKKIIPHREPFLLIDEILELSPGKRVVARKKLKKDELWFKGHFPDFPVQPGVLTVEMLAQAGAVCILSLPENREKIALFGGIDKARFKKQVLPGESLVLNVEIIKTIGPVGYGKAVAKVEDKVAVKCELMFALKQ